jgi:hypothetical protein
MNPDMNFLNNDYVAAGIALLVALYASKSSVKLPKFVKNLFNNSIFRVVFLSLLLTQYFNKAPHVALAVALVFIMTLYFIEEQEIKENFAYIDSFRSQARYLK